MKLYPPRAAIARPSTLVAIFAALIIAAAAPAAAQIPNLTASTATPLPGYGHTYTAAKLPTGANALRVFGGTVSEYVNPATGSLSWRICATVPKGR